MKQWNKNTYQSIWINQSPKHFTHSLLFILLINLSCLYHSNQSFYFCWIFWLFLSSIFFHWVFSSFIYNQSYLNIIVQQKKKANKFKLDKIAFYLLWNDLNETINSCCNCCFEEKWKKLFIEWLVIFRCFWFSFKNQSFHWKTQFLT